MKKWVAIGLVGLAATGLTYHTIQSSRIQMGPQTNGKFLVSSGQMIEAGTITFDQRLSDLAIHPDGKIVAVQAKNRVFLCDETHMLPKSDIAIGSDSGFHGIVWTPDGKRLFVTTDAGHLQEFTYDGATLQKGQKIDLSAPDKKLNPVPGGMCINRSGTKLYVACADWDGVVQLDLTTNAPSHFYPSGKVPFSCALSPDQDTLLVSNWGGKAPEKDDLTMASGKTRLVINNQGSVVSGTVTITNLTNGDRNDVTTSLHPTEIVCDDNRAYVACAMSDAIDVIDLQTKKRTASWPIRTTKYKLIGSMPNALAKSGDTLYVADGGDNAICELDTKTGKVKGFRSAGYYPTAVHLSNDASKAFVLNTKGNGSVRETLKSKSRRNTHDFQGSVSVIDLTKDIKPESEKVAINNSWNDPASNQKPNLKVYQGAIRHVIYVIKENHTYDDIFGDLPQGNGDASLCSLGEKVMPNHRKIAQTFSLFDNAYTSGTNSADGHHWCDEAFANDYLEHFYVGYSRTYPDDGTDALSINSGDRIWDAAMKKGLKVRVYGEWADDENPIYKPRKPKDWFEAWEDRKSGRNEFQYLPTTEIPSLRAILAPGYHYWPLIQSDQSRIDTFEKEFRGFEADGKLPNLMVMTLPCDHSEGTSPSYPTPRAMMADNDYALGRLVSLVSHSKYWKDTAIVVTEDDSQSGPDHVDGHRTSTMIVSPYTKRKYVCSEFLTQVNLHKTMGMMLGFGPLGRFDAIARPAVDCFTNTPDYAPYEITPNNIPFDEPNPGRVKAMTKEEKFWADKTASLDWSSMDRADPYWVNRITWWSIYHGSKPYPGRPNEKPETDDGEILTKKDN
jgi:DNA-binding beta-propeller fold protein YncE